MSKKDKNYDLEVVVENPLVSDSEDEGSSDTATSSYQSTHSEKKRTVKKTSEQPKVSDPALVKKSSELPQKTGDRENLDVSKHKEVKDDKDAATEHSAGKDEESGESHPKTSKEAAAVVQKIMEDLKTSPKGLDSAEAQTRLAKYGPNTIEHKEVSPFVQLLKSFWNPLAWVMEVAAIISISLQDWADFALILALLLVNAAISFFESRQASNSIKVLLKSLAPTCICLRDGKANPQFPPQDLVPGDVVIIKIGSIIPADCVLLKGEGLLVDESSITGESLPVEKAEGDKVLSGSICKRGEVPAIVQSTGKDTVFGKTAKLTGEAKNEGQFQKILAQVGFFCISFIAVGVVIELIVQFGVRKATCTAKNCEPLENILVLIVGGIPVAMPTVLSVTLAIGAHQLAKQDAIVSRLSAIEDLCAMDVLCSDKTGTLTKNELTITDPISYVQEYTPEEVFFLTAISVPSDASDPIDVVLLRSMNDQQKTRAQQYSHLEYHPFHPIEKSTWAKIQGPKSVFSIKKGAPQHILEKADNMEAVQKKVNNDIQELGKKGYRCIGVAESKGKNKWNIIGLIPLFDPPRDDTKRTIERTYEKGIIVKMITGDQVAIAKETARQLGLKTNIVTGDWVRDKGKVYQEHGVPLRDLIEEAGGFAQVYPEDKYFIVDRLHKNGHIVGMTGDGVNDTAALKKADIGIAVAGATDAARSAADIVLKTPGLSVIVEAIIGSRKIFQRMKSYCIYSIAMAVRIVVTFVILTTVYNWDFPTIAVVILAVLNDGCMISISRDRATPSETPDRWRPISVFGAAIAYGVYLGISTIVLFEVVTRTDFFQNTFGLAYLNAQQLVGLIYNQVSVSGLATIFVTRSTSLFFLDRPGIPLIVAFVFAQIVASIIGAYGLGGFNGFDGAGWGYVLVAWVWALIWFFPMDCMKALAFKFTKTTWWNDLVNFHKLPYGHNIHPTLSHDAGR